MEIRKANQKDYKRLVISLRNVFVANPYINKNYLKQDIENNACYIIEENNKIVAIASLVYDTKYGMHYIKRLCVPNKKMRSKGYAKELIAYLKEQKKPVAITPWKENVAMRRLVEKLGFEFQYSFQENYMLYLSN